MSITLTPQQDEAVAAFTKWWKEIGVHAKNFSNDIAPFFMQHGYAGTGKSTILPFFIQSCGLDPMKDVAFVAPTGKAAKVMTKKLQAQGITKPAITIHKAMYRPKGLKFISIETQINATVKLLESASAQDRIILQRTIKLLHKDLERAYLSTAPSFQLDPDSPTMRESKLLVVDEASMAGERIADDMLSFGTPILAIGDPGQLQPVGDNPGFFTRDPDHILTEIHRQALDNPIIRASMDIREGRLLQYGNHGGGALRVLTPKQDDVTFDQNRDVQIIVGTNGKRHRMTRELRKQANLHACGPTEGEMLIVTRNSRTHPNLVNGTMLMVTHDTGDLKQGDVTCRVHGVDEDKMPYSLTAIQGIFEENYLGANQWTAPKASVRHAMERKENHCVDWAYCITTHKSQGSQWNDVCVHDESNVFRDQSKQWLYTAVTRAAETLTVVTDNGR